MLGLIYFKDSKNALPVHDSDLIKGSLGVGMIFGQLVFGLLGDALGRNRIYGRELIVTMVGTLLCILLPWGHFSHSSVIAWMAMFRVLTGFGIGGGKITKSLYHHPLSYWTLIRLPTVIVFGRREDSTRIQSSSRSHCVFLYWTRRYQLKYFLPDSSSCLQKLHRARY